MFIFMVTLVLHSGNQHKTAFSQPLICLLANSHKKSTQEMHNLAKWWGGNELLPQFQLVYYDYKKVVLLCGRHQILQTFHDVGTQQRKLAMERFEHIQFTCLDKWIPSMLINHDGLATMIYKPNELFLNRIHA